MLLYVCLQKNYLFKSSSINLCLFFSLSFFFLARELKKGRTALCSPVYIIRQEGHFSDRSLATRRPLGRTLIARPDA